MKAAYLETHGGTEVLKYGEVPTPVPKPHEVLVRLKYSSLNHLDIWVRKGLPIKLSYPHILGGDGAGIVEKVGEEVTRTKVGEAVIVHPSESCDHCAHCLMGIESLCEEYKILGENIAGTNAEYVCVPETSIFPKPTNLSFSEAASVGLVFTTAWQMLVERAHVKADQTVLVHASGSGVSLAGIQIATLFGAEVIATSRSKDKLKVAEKFGAKHLIDTESEDFSKVVRKISPKGIDIIFDHVGKVFWERNIKCLKSGGALVTCGATSGHEAVTDLRHVFFRQLRILGSTMGNRRDFPKILGHLETGKLKSFVDREFSLSKTAQAHQYMEEGRQVGKVVLKISS